MLFVCLKQCDNICLNTYFDFLFFSHMTSASEVALSERCGAGAMAAARPTAMPAKL